MSLKAPMSVRKLTATLHSASLLEAVHQQRRYVPPAALTWDLTQFTAVPLESPETESKMPLFAILGTVDAMPHVSSRIKLSFTEE
jgi:hypothetical protein